MSNPENYIAENPTHKTYPSENFIKKGISSQPHPDATDVLPIDIFRMLSAGLQQADIDGGDVLSRLVARPNIVGDAIQQKAHKLAKLSDPSVVPDTLLQHMRTIVGFGDGTGLPDRIYDRLDFNTSRKLINLAVSFWRRRGRRDAIEDLVFSLTGVRPLVLQWFETRNILDEVYVGMELPVIGEFTTIFNLTSEVGDGADPDGDHHVHIRIADENTITGFPLDKTFVKDMIRLCRPMCERYEIAFVDFLDTIIDGRLGHWRTLVGGRGITFEKADHSVASNENDIKNPRRWLPRLELGGPVGGVGTTIAAETATSSTWSSYRWRVSICQDDSVEPWLLYTYADPETISADGLVKGYAVAFFPLFDLVTVSYSDGAGNVTLLGSAFADLQVNKSTWRGIQIDTDSTGATTSIEVGIDGEIVVVAIDVANTLTRGTVAISTQLMSDFSKKLGLGATEVYQHPIETDKVVPIL